MTKDEKVGLGVVAGVIGTFVVVTKLLAGPPPEEDLGNLYGVVTDADTGSPIDGIIITLDGLSYTTLGDGYYEFNNLEPGNYECIVIDPLGRYEEEIMTITIKAGSNTKHINLHPVVVETAYYSGFVREYLTQARIEGATVRITGMGATEVDVTDSQGMFKIGPVLPGVYNVTVTCLGYLEYSGTETLVDGTKTVIIALHEEITMGSLWGYVNDIDTAAPIVGARVAIMGPGSYSALTDTNGRYEIGDITPGNYDGEVSADSYDTLYF